MPIKPPRKAALDPAARKSLEPWIMGKIGAVTDGKIADVTFNEGAAFSAEVHHSTVMTLRLTKQLPKFVMEKEGIFDKIFDRVMAFSGYKDIDFDLYPGFSKNILLMGEDEESIRKFFTPGLIQFFETEGVQHIECNGEALLVFIKMKLARTDEIEKVITRLLAL